MENNMSYDTEIDLLNLLAYLIRRWKSIIAAMLVFAVLLAGFSFIKTDRSVTSAGELAEYEQALIEYENESAGYKAYVQALEDSIDFFKAYVSSSVLFKLPIANCPQASAVVFLQHEEPSTDESHELTSPVLTAYSEWLKSTELDFNGLINPEIDVISDIVEINHGEIVEHSLVLTVYYSDLEGANTLLDAVLAELEGLEKQLSSDFHKHKLIIADRNESIGRADFIYNRQNNITYIQTQLESSLTAAEKALAAIAKPSMPGSFSGSGLVKYAVIGALLGAFLMAAYHCVVYIISAKVRTDADIQNVSHAPLMAIYGSGIKEKGFGKLAAAIEGSKYRADAAYTTAKAAAYLRALDEEYKNILVLGLESEEKIEMLKSQLGSAATERSISFCPAGIDGAAEIQLVENSDAVIIAAERDISRMSAVHQKAELSHMTDKPIVGCVLI